MEEVVYFKRKFRSEEERESESEYSVRNSVRAK